MQIERIILISLIAIASILAIILAISYLCYRIGFKRRDKSEGDPYTNTDKGNFKPFSEECRAKISKLCATEYEPVYISSHDGLKLFARYYHTKEGAPLEIMAHGYRSFSRRDFASVALLALERGHNLLLIDQRSHGKSEGRSLSFGVLESEDIRSWVNYSVERFGEDTKITLMGISMGAATVLLASALGLPHNVKCVIADCPFSSAKKLLPSIIERKKLSPKIMFPFLRLGGLIFGGFDILKASPEEAVKYSDIPTLLIHGMGDKLVPSYMSEEIFENCKTEKKKLLLFPDATHALSIFYDNERYVNEIIAFTEDALSKED